MDATLMHHALPFAWHFTSAYGHHVEHALKAPLHLESGLKKLGGQL